LIAILLGIAILILIASWSQRGKEVRIGKKKRKLEVKWSIFIAVIPIIIAYMILATFPIYDVGGNSAIATALITPIAGYVVQLIKDQQKPKVGSAVGNGARSPGGDGAAMSSKFQCSVCGAIFTTEEDGKQHLKKEAAGELIAYTNDERQIAKAQEALNQNG
jgi:hypothetical protein